jgi:hypothetical protein
MTNQDEMTNEETENYFIENDFSEEALVYLRGDLLNRKMEYQREHGFYDNQAQMFARMAEQAKGNAAAVMSEFKLVNEALHEIRLQKKKVS